MADADNPQTSQAGADADDAEPAARIGEDVITIGEVDERIKEELFQRQAGGDPGKLHEMRRETLETLIRAALKALAPKE